jgi:hypothetical protein
MRSHYEQNEFLVECYDPIYNKITTLKMYFATEEKKKLYTVHRNRFDNGRWEEFLLLAGVQEYQLEMIGTNNELDTVAVSYNLNAPSDVGDYEAQIGGQDVAKGGDFICGTDLDRNVVDETFDGKYRFVGWNDKPDGSGQTYLDGYAYTTYNSMTLYAIWETADTQTLTYSYGISSPMFKDGKPVFTSQVKYNQSIGVLPSFDASPAVVVDGSEYFPYSNGKWYKTAVKATNSVAVKDNDLYWSQTNGQIYLLYDTAKYTVEYYVDGVKHTTTSVEYNTGIPNLDIYKTGYKLSAWYLDSEMKNPAPQLMPPYPIKLYAKWS